MMVEDAGHGILNPSNSLADVSALSIEPAPDLAFSHATHARRHRLTRRSRRFHRKWHQPGVTANQP